MKQRGRKPKDAHVVDIGIAKRPKPPAELTQSEAALWDEIVASRPPEYFDVAAIPLLREFCRIQTQLNFLAESIGEFEPDWLKDKAGLSRYKDLCSMQDKAQSRSMLLATKMRLTQQARYVPDAKASKPTTGQGPKPWET